jgi:hypothetical protein
MTVNELKELLDQFDGDLEVKFTYTASDYWRTRVASGISDAEEGYVKYSSYHRMDKVTEDEDEDDKNVLLLS